MNKKSKVVGLFGPILNDGTRTPQASVVRDLKAALQRAQAGETVGIGLIEVYRDGTTAAAATGKVERRVFLGTLVEMLVYEAGCQ